MIIHYRYALAVQKGERDENNENKQDSIPDETAWRCKPWKTKINGESLLVLPKHHDHECRAMP